MICIKNGTLHTAVTRETFVADILIDNGKIVTIGKHISSENAEVIDATGLHVYPGFIDAHCTQVLMAMESATRDRTTMN